MSKLLILFGCFWLYPLALATGPQLVPIQPLDFAGGAEEIRLTTISQIESEQGLIYIRGNHIQGPNVAVPDTEPSNS